jgi:hypothetical protein
MSPPKKISKIEEAKKMLDTTQLEDKTWDTTGHNITNMVSEFLKLVLLFLIGVDVFA